ncbi:DNA alkylation repair protein, partial [Ligilactobacillus saerimneri]
GAFFLNNAIGCALREYSKSDSEWVGNYLAEYQGQLAPLSVREASKYL